MKKSLLLLLVLFSVGCGKRPVFSYPADQQTMKLTDISTFDVSFEDGVYQDRVIEVRGNVQNFCCVSYPGSVTRCYGPKSPGGNPYTSCGRAAGTGGGCTQNCVVTFVGYNSGDDIRNASFITINLQ